MRANTVQILKDGCQQTLPLLCLTRYFFPDRPIVWFLVWIGFRFLYSWTKTTSLLAGDGNTNNNHGNSIKRMLNHNHGQQHQIANYTSTKESKGMIDDTRNKTSMPSSCIPTSKSMAGRGDANNASANAPSTCKEKMITTAPSSSLTLPALPSTVLSSVSCYLHPRDVLEFDTVLQSAFFASSCHTNNHQGQRGGDLNSNDIILHDIWKRLWYRDYGDVLLRWKIARGAFARSLLLASSEGRLIRENVLCIHENNEVDNTNNAAAAAQEEDAGEAWLDERLSNHLDGMTKMKEFYFLFALCHIDYLLARKNSPHECYLGLHGHVFDFTDFAEYHPGLIEPILKECGGDATAYFEDLPHSMGARNVARRLAVLVDHDAILTPSGGGNQNDDGDVKGNVRCGLELVRENNGDSLERRKRMLRLSNTRLPQTMMDYNSTSKDVQNNEGAIIERGRRNRWMKHLLPRRREPRRRPTLWNIRIRFERERAEEERRRRSTIFGSKSGNDETRNDELSLPDNSFLDRMVTLPEGFLPYYSQLFWKRRGLRSETNPPHWRIYYDPLLRTWMRWNAEST